MALPVNVGELIENRVVESTRIEYKSDWVHSAEPNGLRCVSERTFCGTKRTP